MKSIWPIRNTYDISKIREIHMVNLLYAAEIHMLINKNAWIGNFYKKNT